MPEGPVIFTEGVPYHGDLTKEQQEVLVHLQKMVERLRKRRWQLWFALCGRGGVSWTSDPSLFDVVWVPALQVLSNRSFRKALVVGSNVNMLWEYWKENHLPWRLRRKVNHLQELRRSARREASDLRQQLVTDKQSQG